MTDLGIRLLERIHVYKGEIIEAPPLPSKTKQSRERRKQKSRARNKVAKASRKANRVKS